MDPQILTASGLIDLSMPTTMFQPELVDGLREYTLTLPTPTGSDLVTKMIHAHPGLLLTITDGTREWKGMPHQQMAHAFWNQENGWNVMFMR
jgi:hypothetical protein